MIDYKSAFSVVVGRLGAIAAVLVAFTSTTSPGVSLEPSFCASPTWDVSDASLTAPDVESFRRRAVEVALAEVRTTYSVLDTPELLHERAFGEFIERIGAALDAYEASAHNPQRMMVLATSLAISRAFLQAHIGTLASWAALVRAADSSNARYVPVPARFASTSAFSIARERPPTAEDIAATFEFDQRTEV
jgi:hypothetical protein